MVQLSGPIERGFSVFRRKCAKAWQHLKKKPAAFKYRQTTITHQPFHFANNRAASCNHYMGLRGRVCVSCIIVGLQMYVCIQSAHCKTVVRCWFTCKSVIEKENRCKPLRLALGTKLLFRVKLTVLLVLNSAFEVIFDKGLRSTTYSSFIYLFIFAFIDRKVQRPGRQWSPFSPCRSLQHTSRLLNHVSYSNALDSNFIRCKMI